MIIEYAKLLIPFSKNGAIPKNFCVSDVDYFCPTLDLVQRELFPKYWKWLKSLKLTKWVHKWDCDNFADSFKLFTCGYYQEIIESTANGIAIGVIFYKAKSKAEDGLEGTHAINIIYIDNGKNQDGTNNFYPIFIEPQNGKIYKLSKEEFNSIYTVYI
jgi:hypothetical protein